MRRARAARAMYLTFQHEYPERAEEYDISEPFLEQAVTVITDMRKEAEATLASLALATAPDAAPA